MLIMPNVHVKPSELENGLVFFCRIDKECVEWIQRDPKTGEITANVIQENIVAFRRSIERLGGTIISER